MDYANQSLAERLAEIAFLRAYYIPLLDGISPPREHQVLFDWMEDQARMPLQDEEWKAAVDHARNTLHAMLPPGKHRTSRSANGHGPQPSRQKRGGWTPDSHA